MLQNTVINTVCVCVYTYICSVLWPIYVYMSVCIYVSKGRAIVRRLLSRVLNTNTDPSKINVLFSQYSICSLRIRLRVSATKVWPSSVWSNLIQKRDLSKL